jgi:Bacterial lipid A biosynthesis acyltransferase
MASPPRSGRRLTRRWPLTTRHPSPTRERKRRIRVRRWDLGLPAGCAFAVGLDREPSPGAAWPAGGSAGGLVGLLSERHLTGSGIEVEFFGEPARIMGGPAALAGQTGAALMPVTLWYEGKNWAAHIHQEIPVPETGTRQEIAAMTQRLARVLGEGIARHPQDWHHAAEGGRGRPSHRRAAPRRRLQRRRINLNIGARTFAADGGSPIVSPGPRGDRSLSLAACRTGRV